MCIMSQDNVATVIELRSEFVKAAPAQGRMVGLIVLRVDAGANNVVSEVRHGSENDVVEEEKWRAHVGWEEADSAKEGRFEVCHLSYDGWIVEGCKGNVTPSARSQGESTEFSLCMLMYKAKEIWGTLESVRMGA